MMIGMVDSPDQTNDLATEVIRRHAGTGSLSHSLIGLLIVIVIVVLLLGQGDPGVGMAP